MQNTASVGSSAPHLEHWPTEALSVTVSSTRQRAVTQTRDSQETLDRVIEYLRDVPFACIENLTDSLVENEGLCTTWKSRTGIMVKPRAFLVASESGQDGRYLA